MCLLIFNSGIGVGVLLHTRRAVETCTCSNTTTIFPSTPAVVLGNATALLLPAAKSVEALSRPSQVASFDEPGFNCSRLSSVRQMTKLGSGITKSAFKISLGGTEFVAKRVKPESPDTRTRMGVYKLLKEAHILQVLHEEHPNAMRVEGVCTFSEDGVMQKFDTGVTTVYEFQAKLENIPSDFVPWRQLLQRFEQCSLGSIQLTDVKKEQFTVIRGDLNMHDMDDVFIHASRDRSIVHSNCNIVIERMHVQIGVEQCVAGVLRKHGPAQSAIV